MAHKGRGIQQSGSNFLLELVFIGRNAGWARFFFARRRQFDADVLEVRQGELPKYGGKRPVQAALSACEYRFLASFAENAAQRKMGWYTHSVALVTSDTA